MLSEHRFKDQNELQEALRDFFVERIERSLQRHSKTTVLLSGGNSPLPFYRMLGQHDIDWERLHLALVDERWVPQSDPNSNEGLLRGALGEVAAKRLTGMYNGAAEPGDAVAEINARYDALPRPWALGLMGLGPDGHTASLFPNADGLGNALSTKESCAAITAQPSPVTGSNIKRMTLSLSALLGIEHLVLLFTGEAKWTVYASACTIADKQSLPISYLLQQNEIPIDVFWSP